MSFRRLAMFGACAVVGLGSGSMADARPASTGWFVEGGLGAGGYLADGGQAAAVGPTLEVAAGLDLTRWASLGLRLGMSSHEATVPAPPVDEWFQRYTALLELRVDGRFDVLGVYARADLGAALLSSNVLERVMITEPGEEGSLAIGGGAGLTYQLGNRHYALGLGGDVLLMPQFDGLMAVSGHVFLRYTK